MDTFGGVKEHPAHSVTPGVVRQGGCVGRFVGTGRGDYLDPEDSLILSQACTVTADTLTVQARGRIELSFGFLP